MASYIWDLCSLVCSGASDYSCFLLFVQFDRQLVVAVGVVAAWQYLVILMDSLSGCHQITHRQTLSGNSLWRLRCCSVKPANVPSPIATTLTPRRGAHSSGCGYVWPAAWPFHAFHQAVAVPPKFCTSSVGGEVVRCFQAEGISKQFTTDFLFLAV